MSEPKDDARQVSLRRVLLHPEQPPKALHQIIYTRVGSNIVMELGFHDLPEVRETLLRAKSDPEAAAEVAFYVTDRFVLTPDAISAMWTVTKLLVEDLKREEVKFTDPESPTRDRG